MTHDEKPMSEAEHAAWMLNADPAEAVALSRLLDTVADTVNYPGLPAEDRLADLDAAWRHYVELMEVRAEREQEEETR